MSGIVDVLDQFPIGASVEVYAEDGRFPLKDHPQGSLLATATVAADGTLTLPLATGDYQLHAIVNGQDVWKRVQTGALTALANLTDVSTVGLADGKVLGWRAADGKYEPRAPIEVLNVKNPEYGCVLDGVHDDSVGFAAAVTAAGAGGIVYVPPGTLNMASVQATPTVNSGGRLVIRGAGRQNTLFHLSDSSQSVLGTPSLNPATPDTVQYVEMEDFTVGIGTRTLKGAGAVLQLTNGSNTVGFNVDSVLIQRVDTQGFGNLTTGAGFRGVNILVQRSDRYGATQNTLSRIAIERCYFGRTGGGSNCGVLIGATDTSQPPSNVRWNNGGTNLPAANVVWTQIKIADCQHDSGAAPTGPFTSANFQVGGDGRGDDVVIERCYGFNSGDVGVEVDNTLNLRVVNCVMVNSWNECYFYANNHGGGSTVHKAITQFIGCVGIRNVSKATAACFAAYTTFGTEFGHLVFDRCVAISDQPTYLNSGGTFVNPNALFQIQGPTRNLTFTKCVGVMCGISYTAGNSQLLTPVGIELFLTGGESFVTVDDFRFRVEGSFDLAGATGGSSAQYDAIQIRQATKLHLDVRKVRTESNVTRLNSYSFSLRGVVLNTAASNVTVDWGALNGAANYAGDLLLDAGTASDLAVGTNNLTSVANHTVEKRFRWLQNGSNTNAQILRQQDGGIYLGFTPDTTINGFKAGAVLKAADASNYVEAYVTDNGTNSIINIDKVVAGVRTNLATATLGARIIAATANGIRGILVGDTLTLDYFLTGTVPSAATAGATTLAYTFSTAESALFGQDSTVQFVGFSWVPMGAAATVQNLRNDRFNVIIGGVIDGVYPGTNVQTINILQPVTIAAGSASTRIHGRLRIRDVACANQHKETINEVKFSDNTLKTKILLENIGYAAGPPAPAAVTVTASPFTYTNADGFREDVAIYSGTVSVVTVTRSGGSAQQVAAATNVVIPRLEPGDAVTVTYSVAPTMSKVPIP